MALDAHLSLYRQRTAARGIHWRVAVKWNRAKGKEQRAKERARTFTDWETYPGSYAKVRGLLLLIRRRLDNRGDNVSEQDGRVARPRVLRFWRARRPRVGRR